MVHADPHISERAFDRAQHLSDLRKMGRGGRAGADHRVCKQRGGSGDRVSRQRGQRVRLRGKDLYDLRTGDPVRNLYKLAAGAGLLALGHVVKQPVASEVKVNTDMKKPLADSEKEKQAVHFVYCTQFISVSPQLLSSAEVSPFMLVMLCSFGS